MWHFKLQTYLPHKLPSRMHVMPSLLISCSILGEEKTTDGKALIATTSISPI